MKARISHLHKTEAEWLKLSFVPAAGELVIYDPDDKVNYPRLKIGDGKHSLHELNFFVDSVVEELLKNYVHSEHIDAGRVTDYPKN